MQFFESNDPAFESWSVEHWKQQLQRLFSDLHSAIRKALLEQSPDRVLDSKNIVRAPSGDPIHGGSTGSVVVQVKRVDGSSVCISANVGDSCTLLCPLDRKAQEKFAMLSVDHGPENHDVSY